MGKHNQVLYGRPTWNVDIEMDELIDKLKSLRSKPDHIVLFKLTSSYCLFGSSPLISFVPRLVILVLKYIKCWAKSAFSNAGENFDDVLLRYPRLFIMKCRQGHGWPIPNYYNAWRI